jgi:hypothetical protein
MFLLSILMACSRSGPWERNTIECVARGEDVSVTLEEPTGLGFTAVEVLATLGPTVQAYGLLGAMELEVVVESNGVPYVGDRAREDQNAFPELDPAGLFCIDGHSLFTPVQLTLSNEALGSCAGAALVVAQEDRREAIWVGTPPEEFMACEPGSVVLEWAESLRGCVEPWFELQLVGRPDLPWSEGVSGFVRANCADGGAVAVTLGDVAAEFDVGAFPPESL